jgi:hypothetical protein
MNIEDPELAEWAEKNHGKHSTRVLIELAGRLEARAAELRDFAWMRLMKLHKIKAMHSRKRNRWN